MDATPQGDSPAASPTADATTHSSSADAAFDAGFEAANAGEAPSQSEPPADAKAVQAKPEGNQPPDGEESAEAEKADDAEQADDEGQPKSKTERRVQQLLQQRKEARNELTKVKQDFASKEARYKLALEKVVQDFNALKQQLSQYEDVDSPEFRLRDMESRQRVQERLAREQRQLQERFQKEQFEAETQEARQALVDAMDDALAEYPHLTRPQLQERFKAYARQNPDVTFDQAPDVFKTLAEEMDRSLFERFESRVLEKHAPKLKAPSPVSSTGTVPQPKAAMTDEEFAAHLDQVMPGMFD